MGTTPPHQTPPTDTTTTTTSNNKKFNQHTSIFKSDPTVADSYDVKFGIKTKSEIEEEARRDDELSFIHPFIHSFLTRARYARPHPQKRLRSIKEREADVRRHKREKRDAELERERLRRQIEEDKMERKAKGGYLNSRLGAEGYAPDALLKNTDGWTGSSAKKTEQVDKRPPEEILQEACEKLAMYKSGGEGGMAMGLLVLYIGNVVDNPEEIKYRGINTGSKAYTSKLKGKIGVGKLLKTLGWKRDGKNENRLVLEDVNLQILRDAKRVIERRKHAFEAEQQRAQEAALQKMAERAVRP